MTGYRARLGFLVPPGNPTTEPEVIRLAPPGVSVHFTRMVAHGVTGSLDGQEERNRTQIAHLDENIALLSMVKPDVIVLAHTATSYTLGMAGEKALVERIERASGIRFITAFGSVVAALRHLGVSRLAAGTPYSEAATRQCKANLEAHGFEVANIGRLAGVSNIYDETPERAYRLGRQVDVPAAQAVFLSGVGMPTIATLQALEDDLGKPVLSSASAMLWNALRIAGVRAPIAGFGSLLALRAE
jgi:maleate cis-trans isomerase